MTAQVRARDVLVVVGPQAEREFVARDDRVRVQCDVCEQRRDHGPRRESRSGESSSAKRNVPKSATRRCPAVAAAGVTAMPASYVETGPGHEREPPV